MGRRPPLTPELAEMAHKVAEAFLLAEEVKAKELAEIMKGCTNSFERLRNAFLAVHEDQIRQGLESVFPGTIKLKPAPLAAEVQNRFLASLRSAPTVEMRPAFHGTDASNHGSIFKRGLLIPGDGNNLRVVHGSAHGRGVYTANIDAAWLSKGFCTAPTMLVCAVLQIDVRYAGDAMVVGNSDHVVPLFEGSGTSFMSTASATAAGTFKPVKPVKPVTVQGPTYLSHGKRKPTAKDKALKFKARLAAQSQRH